MNKLRLRKIAVKLMSEISSSEWKKTYKVGDYVEMSYLYGNKKERGRIVRLTNDDIWLDNGRHYDSLTWSPEKIEIEK